MYGPLQRVVIELKILRGSLDAVIEKGLEQATDYSQRVGADETHLVIFNRDPAAPWDQKIWQRQADFQSKLIHIWGA